MTVLPTPDVAGAPGLGLGLPLIRRVADGFDHREPPDGGTELWMRFVLPHGV